MGSVGGFVGSDITGVSPNLSELGDYGGFGNTHLLLPGSPAIDAGSTTSAPATDQRGFQRPLDADVDSNVGIDIGATEVTPDQLAHLADAGNVQTLASDDRGSQQSVAHDGNGNYVIVWSSQNTDGDGWGVYARWFDRDGLATTNLIPVNETTAENQHWARVASDSNGNFVVSWTHSDGTDTPQDVYFRRFDSNGNPLTGEIRANTHTLGQQKDSALAMEPNGDFIIAWEGSGADDPNGIYFRRFHADGTAKDAVDQIVSPIGPDVVGNPTLALQSSGQFVVTWERDDQAIFFQQFDADGGKQGSAVRVNGVGESGEDAKVATADNGDFIVVYRQSSGTPGIYQRGFFADGSEKFAASLIAAGPAESPSIDIANDGTAIVTWHQAGSESNVFAQKFDTSGNALTSSFQLNYTAGDQFDSSVAVVDADHALIAWHGSAANDNQAIAFRVLGASPGSQYAPVAADDSVTTLANTPATIDPLANDFDPNMDPLALFDFQRAQHGELTDNGDGTLTYTPDTDFVGNDSFRYVATDGSDDTVHYWKLDGNANDSVGSADGILSGTTDVEGYFGGGQAFDGNDDFVLLPDIDYGDDFTLSLRFKIDDLSGTTNQYLYGHNVSVLNNGLHIFVGENGSSSPGILSTSFHDNNDSILRSAFDIDINAIVGDGNWHTYTLVRKLGSDSKVYIDGVLRASDSRGSDAFDPSGNVFLGRREFFSSGLHYGGALDSVQLIGRALSDSQVADHHMGDPHAVVNVSVEGQPTDISLPLSNLDENTDTSFGFNLGPLSATDLDPGETFTFSIQPGGDGSKFSLGGSNGNELFLDDGILDFETTSSYTVNLRVTDSQSHTYDESFTITVNNVNESPTAISPSHENIDENTDTSSGHLVGSLTTVDGDIGDTFSYALVGGADISHFSLTGSNNDQLVFTAGILNHEVKAFYEVVVRTTDAGGLSHDEQVTITVNDLFEPPSINVNAPLGSISEDADTSLPIVVGQFTLAGEIQGSPFLALGGRDANLFEIHGNQLWLKAGTPLDHEQQSELQVELVVDDPSLPGTPDAIAQMTIAILNANESPSGIGLSGHILPEKSPGHEVGTLSFSDPDIGDTHVLAVDDNRFEIVAGKLRLKPGHSVSFATEGQIPLTVTVTDAGGLQSQSHFTLNVVPNSLLQAPLEPTEKTSAEIEKSQEPEDADPIDGALPVPATGKSHSAPATGQSVPPPADTEPNRSLPDSFQEDRQIVIASHDSNPTYYRALTRQASSLDNVTVSNVELYTATRLDHQFVAALDSIRNEVVNNSMAHSLVVGSSVLVSGSLSVGYVFWLLRGGVLLSSMLSSMPAWRLIDPLPVLGIGGSDSDDNESLESLVEKGKASLNQSSDSPSKPEPQTETTADENLVK